MGPGKYGPILVQNCEAKGEGNTTMRNRLQAMQWGLVPSFTKASTKPDHFLMFNARSESLQDRPAFKRLLESKRCIVLCEGFYEWQQVDKREKQPYYIYRKDIPMKFAGLYDQWQSEAGALVCTYTILTTAVSPELKWLHSRMPVILSEEGVNRWLSRAKFEGLKDLLVSYRSHDLKWYPVDKKVGSMQFQGKKCATKINIKHAGDIKSFFGMKREFQKPIISSPVTPAIQVKMRKKTLDDASTSTMDKPNVIVDAALNTPVNHPPTKFVPASSLLKNCLEDEENDSLSKRRRVSSPVRGKTPVKMGQMKSPADTKQSSLDFFFRKSTK